MATSGFPLIERSAAKGREGEPELSQWRVAIDAYEAMVGFLKLTPERAVFTEDSRQAIKDGLATLAALVGQMDAGQRDKGVSFDEIPHVMARVCVGCMLMELSGALDRLEVDA